MKTRIMRLRRWAAQRLRKAAFRVDGKIALAIADASEIGIDRDTLVSCVEAAMPEIEKAVNRQARVALAAKAELDAITAKGAKRC